MCHGPCERASFRGWEPGGLHGLCRPRGSRRVECKPPSGAPRTQVPDSINRDHPPLCSVSQTGRGKSKDKPCMGCDLCRDARRADRFAQEVPALMPMGKWSVWTDEVTLGDEEMAMAR